MLGCLLKARGLRPESCLRSPLRPSRELGCGKTAGGVSPGHLSLTPPGASPSGGSRSPTLLFSERGLGRRYGEGGASVKGQAWLARLGGVLGAGQGAQEPLPRLEGAGPGAG